MLSCRNLAIKHLPERHTCEKLSIALYAILEEWGILDKVTAMTTDNAKKKSKISQNIIELLLLQNKQQRIKNGPGFKIDLDEDDDIEDFLLDGFDTNIMDNFKNMVDKCRKIVGIFHQSIIIPEILGEKQSIANVYKHNLVQDVQTMWNSTFLMLEKHQEQAEVVNETLIDRRLQKKFGDQN
ncbi:unnamed protein product [Brachionus calyciflorus]|uniref:Uncharacterized protein n=1 Tax=Brachionus calyciflorus TaxID=104777 RepID=A0A814CDQ7_9BILA|nr:unnamed protein product [Brachionus calyciflorus]